MKNNNRAHAGIFLALALLSGCASPGSWGWAGGERLSACTADGGPFEKLELEKWPETYHEKVSKVIDAHVKKMERSSAAEITCTADDYAGMLEATPELAALAATLKPWQGRKVSELEMAPVLLEYLRTYECSLQEKSYFLPGASSGALAYGTYIDRNAGDQALIGREMASARPVLERTLALVSGSDRLLPLALDVECIRRTSLDLRNILGLAAEAAACMPRATDARGSLRDLGETPSATQ